MDKLGLILNEGSHYVKIQQGVASRDKTKLLPVLAVLFKSQQSVGDIYLPALAESACGLPRGLP